MSNPENPNRRIVSADADLSRLLGTAATSEPWDGAALASDEFMRQNRPTEETVLPQGMHQRLLERILNAYNS